ncbi:hypothetical protein L2E82_08807 [Cichorium intybus]|uniref:Uncharacterized protein n=1 Tax=Cichorium intybus TaxID=13427 RepID=A0ACB9G712_CICIN|nr:hypothetical protein L2E82_08807 [Cichorium intybus]
MSDFQNKYSNAREGEIKYNLGTLAANESGGHITPKKSEEKEIQNGIRSGACASGGLEVGFSDEDGEQLKLDDDADSVVRERNGKKTKVIQNPTRDGKKTKVIQNPISNLDDDAISMVRQTVFEDAVEEKDTHAMVDEKGDASGTFTPQKEEGNVTKPDKGTYACD